jgi:hypothetical protein
MLIERDDPLFRDVQGEGYKELYVARDHRRQSGGPPGHRHLPGVSGVVRRRLQVHPDSLHPQRASALAPAVGDGRAAVGSFRPGDRHVRAPAPRIHGAAARHRA